MDTILSFDFSQTSGGFSSNSHGNSDVDKQQVVHFKTYGRKELLLSACLAKRGCKGTSGGTSAKGDERSVEESDEEHAALLQCSPVHNLSVCLGESGCKGTSGGNQSGLLQTSSIS